MTPCGFPALFSSYTAMIESEGKCPMCSSDVSLASIRKLDEAEASDWLHGATKKENAVRKLQEGGLRAAVKKGGLGSIVNAAKAKGVEPGLNATLDKAVAAAGGAAPVS